MHSMLSFVCMARTYIGLYVMTGLAGSTGHSYHSPLLPPHAPTVLPHSVSSMEQVCPTVRPHMSNADGGAGGRTTAETLDKKSPHFAAYALLSHSRSPHNVLPSPSHSCGIM